MIATVDDIPVSWRALLGSIQLHLPSAVLAGGALRDRDNGRPIKDLDIFVRGESDRDLVQARQVLVDGGYVCAEIDPNQMYPIAEGEVIGFFDARDPTIHPAGADQAVQIIVVRWDTSEIVSRFDFGICQIAFDGAEVTRTAAYSADKESRAFSIVRERKGHALEASVERYARLSAKYPGWRFQLGAALDVGESDFAPI